MRPVPAVTEQPADTGGLELGVDARVVENGARDRDALAFSTREPRSPFADDRIVSLWQPGDKVVRVCRLRRGDNLTQIAARHRVTLEELRRWRPKVTEAHISACLGEVANARTAGTVNAPRSLFFHRLKNTIGQPTPTAWTKAQVLAALRPATATSAPDMRRPDLQTPDVPPPFTETPEERQARLKVSRAAYEAMSAILKETSKND